MQQARVPPQHASAARAAEAVKNNAEAAITIFLIISFFMNKNLVET
jgi:hypothetical protein